MNGQKMDRARYLAQSRMAEVVDRLVGELMGQQPEDLPAWLAQHAAGVAHDVLGTGGATRESGNEKPATFSTLTINPTAPVPVDNREDWTSPRSPSEHLPDVSEVGEHHLSCWEKDPPARFCEAEVNTVPNPMQTLWPQLRFHNPAETVRGRIIEKDTLDRSGMSGGSSGAFVRSGAVRNIWFDSRQVTAGILTCGGLCPGLNSIIREVTRALRHCYGVESVLGFRGGYNGLTKEDPPPMVLTTENCREIHLKGGSILAAGRGGFNPDKCVDGLQRRGVNMLFVVGGDGTQWAADVLCQCAKERGVKIAVVGVPKSIDNDVVFFDRTFGFDTAVQAGCSVIRSGNVEATSCVNGVAIVKLMGRDAGYVARNAALASTLADCVIIPELTWTVEALLEHVVTTLNRKHHMVIVVAEGAGQEHVATGEKDATGHTVYGDIGKFLVTTINGHLKKTIGGRCFYIDPSYIIRSGPADPVDHAYCCRMAYDAAHVAMRGYSGVVVGSVHNYMVMVPMMHIAGRRRVVKLNSSIWQATVQSAKMPASMSGMAKGSKQKQSGMLIKKARGSPAMYREGGECAGAAT